ncbi:fumarylacetoacetate hydrolase family protein [Ancylobacter sonchi]|uniref:fumarylacetoacetate hydrolase family protein n=1 Tax=Ancylobacter sonchi TaxID=1937790 RepID=UPI001BD64475|nr:fumarylacetoacetate hydrolase family protein [Ancylobacter sonchi]MBS7533417.1 fumarylacetoacetate hydrolase family protein [Ancylobacter sonchi]
MKLVRFGDAGQERPGLYEAAGKIRDLGGIVPDLAGDALLPASLARIAAIPVEELPLVPGTPRLGAPVGRPGNFIAIGLNYADHAAETGAEIPSEPVIFSKAPNCIVGPDDDVMLPRGSTKLDWEVEIAIVIGAGGSCIARSEALRHVAGFCICNDVSEREFQIERNGQWVKGKSAPTFGPLGPWLVTPEEIGDVQKLSMWLDVNGRRRQTGSTSTMIFDIATVIAYVSEFIRLDPGDIITTGTPPGVALGMKPPVYLKEGDVMTLGIEGLGEQRQSVVGWRKAG